MAEKSMWDAPDLVPSLIYNDLPRAIEWFERVFGFTERSEARLTWPGGGRTWFEVGNSLFNITTSDDHWGDASNDVANGVKMKIYVENLDEHFARVKAAGATIVSEPEDGFWGGRIYRVLDLEGNKWEISQRGRDLAARDWQLPPGVKMGIPDPNK